MEDFEGMIGYFDTTVALRAAARRARDAWFYEVEVYLPMGDEITVDAVVPGPSPVPWIAGLGALGAGGFGLWLAIWTSHDYPLVTGGMPITSLPPFLVTAFELLILGAASGAIVGFARLARLPDLRPSGGYSSDLAVDTLALLIRCAPVSADQARAEALLRDCGATEVRPVRRRECGPLGDAR